MKKLLPSLREKKRYIAFEIESESRLDREEIINAVDSSCKSFIGDFYSGKAGIMVLDETISNNKGVLKVGNKYLDLVKSGLMMIRKVNGKNILFKNVKVSGSLGKSKNKINQTSQENRASKIRGG
ncbi:hypothetical protein HYT56_02810 [Candidatus Woesearchaeota archaeon]|nr:hypothetical protein [Candidatus Woesearchaeota archaeon]